MDFKVLELPAMHLPNLSVGDRIMAKGVVFAGRDAVLPKLCAAIKDNNFGSSGIDLSGAAIFHTAVSDAGIGPTSSNKVELEESFLPLCEAGVKVFLGKGELHADTVRALGDYGAVYIVVPPVTALLSKNMRSKECVAYPELGMEAFWRLELDGCPGIVASVGGDSIFERDVQ